MSVLTKEEQAEYERLKDKNPVTREEWKRLGELGSKIWKSDIVKKKVMLA